MAFLAEKNESTFYEIASMIADKVRIVVTFLALLELIRNKQVLIRQVECFDDIIIVKMPEGVV